MAKARELIEECKDLKNKIDDCGKEGQPEEPPFLIEEFEEMKRTVRKNRWLMIGFVLSEGAFNYFALKALFPGRGLGFEAIRVVAALAISLVALFLIEGLITTHFDYLELKTKDGLSAEEKQRKARVKSKRSFYIGATILLICVIFALGIVREFIIAGGTSLNFWAMMVTVGLALVLAIALGIQGAEVTEVLFRYNRMKTWMSLRDRIDDLEKRVRGILDEVNTKLEENIANYWYWVYYLRYWLKHDCDEEDREKPNDMKSQLPYRDKNAFQAYLFEQCKTPIETLKGLRQSYLALLNFHESTVQKQELPR